MAQARWIQGSEGREGGRRDGARRDKHLRECQRLEGFKSIGFLFSKSITCIMEHWVGLHFWLQVVLDGFVAYRRGVQSSVEVAGHPHRLQLSQISCPCPGHSSTCTMMSRTWKFTFVTDYMSLLFTTGHVWNYWLLAVS